jgi:hypothetical protein
VTAPVALGGVARAAAWDGGRVWIVVDDDLAAFTPEGDEVLRRPGGAPAVRSLAAGPEGLVAVAGAGVVVWLDGKSGEEVARRPAGGELVAVGGRDGVFVVDRASERAWPAAGGGALGAPVPVPGVARATVARGAVWWTSRHDSAVRGNGMEVELGVPAGAPFAGCAGSVWVGAGNALLRVGAWGGDTSPALPAPFGATALACGDGVLVGASAAGVFVLDPTDDAGVRRLDVDLDEEPAIVVATTTAAWLFSSRAPEARVVPYR